MRHLFKLVLLIGAVVLLLLPLLFRSSQTDKKAGSKTTADHVATTHAPTAAKKQGTGREKTAGSKAATRKQLDGLSAHTVSFLKAYYLVKPDDTEASRRMRLKTLVPPLFLKRLDLGLGEGTPAYAARVKRHLTIQAAVVHKELKAAPAYSGESTWIVSAPVTISSVRSDGRLVNSFTINTVSRWKLRNGKWQILNFTEGGDTG